MTCTTFPAPTATLDRHDVPDDVLDALARDLDTTQPPAAPARAATAEMPATTVSAEARVAPGGFTRVPDWVWLAPISPTAKTLYGILAAHLDPSDPDRQVWPSRETLAALLGLAQARSVDPYLDELIALGAISKTTTYTGQNMRSRNVYTIAWAPPPRPCPRRSRSASTTATAASNASTHDSNSDTNTGPPSTAPWPGRGTARTRASPGPETGPQARDRPPPAPVFPQVSP